MPHLFRYYSIILFVCKTFFISYISIKLCYYYYYFFREYDKHSAPVSTKYYNFYYNTLRSFQRILSHLLAYFYLLKFLMTARTFVVHAQTEKYF